MMRLPALDPRERAYLHALLPDSPVQAFASRLRQRLVAKLGVAAGVGVSPCGAEAGAAAGDEPIIAIEPELASAWLSLRLGGKAGAAGVSAKADGPAAPFRALIRRALAESVVNSGEAGWPQAMRLRVAIGEQQGAVDIYWPGGHRTDWARRVIREGA